MKGIEITSKTNGPVIQEFFIDPDTDKILVYHYINLEAYQDVILNRIVKKGITKDNNIVDASDRDLYDRAKDWLLRYLVKDHGGNVYELREDVMKDIKGLIGHEGNHAPMNKDLEKFKKHPKVKDKLISGEMAIFFYVKKGQDKKTFIGDWVVKRIGKALLVDKYRTEFYYKIIPGDSERPHVKKFPVDTKYYPLSNLPHDVEVTVDENGYIIPNMV